MVGLHRPSERVYIANVPLMLLTRRSHCLLFSDVIGYWDRQNTTRLFCRDWSFDENISGMLLLVDSKNTTVF